MLARLAIDLVLVHILSDPDHAFILASLNLDTKELSDKKQTFTSFRLYDEASDGPNIQQALEEGWECTGIDGKWCRKPFLNR